MKKKFALSLGTFVSALVLSTIGLDSSVHAAVFVLKNVSFAADDGTGSGTYNVTGEFKVDTSGATQRPSAWNINIASTSGTAGFNSTYTFNTLNVPDNSFTAFTANPKGFTLCKTVSGFCDNFIFMLFNTDFKDVYQDGTSLAAPIPGATGTTTVNTIDLKLNGADKTTSGIPGSAQADFVPISPALASLLPLTGLLLRLRKNSFI